MITKKKFMKAVKAAWAKYDYTQGSYYRSSDGKDISWLVGDVCACCAIGGAALELGMSTYELCEHLIDAHPTLPRLVICMGDNAGSKEKAIEALEELTW